MEIIRSIQNRIYEIRGQRVMVDKELASLYGVETKALNLAVKRNYKRFPPDFMFQLTKEEFDFLRFQFETSKNGDSLKPRIINPDGRGGTRYLPYVFTEQGVSMLSSVLNSDTAVTMNIEIMRAFVEIRRITLTTVGFKQQFDEIKERLGGHDAQLNQIYEAMENLLDERAAEKKWDNRRRIGYNE